MSVGLNKNTFNNVSSRHNKNTGRSYKHDINAIKNDSIDAIGSLFEIESTRLKSNEIGCTDLVYEFNLSFAQN